MTGWTNFRCLIDVVANCIIWEGLKNWSYWKIYLNVSRNMVGSNGSVLRFNQTNSLLSWRNMSFKGPHLSRTRFLRGPASSEPSLCWIQSPRDPASVGPSLCGTKLLRDPASVEPSLWGTWPLRGPASLYHERKLRGINKAGSSWANINYPMVPWISLFNSPPC